MNNTNYDYCYILQDTLTEGTLEQTRNHEVFSYIFANNISFLKFPLVTVKRTAIKKAIREMEWFLSGDANCPDELLDWWKGQLSINSSLYNGYSNQLRYASGDILTEILYFDQIKFILASLKTNPNSRRLLISTWNPGEMAYITETNNNPNTPTVCHSIIIHLFVRNGNLHMKTYQRSADLLLGVPHNWVQSWALLLYFAYHSNLKVGSMTWMWGDVHIYNEPTHLLAANSILASSTREFAHNVDLVYQPNTVVYDSKGVPIFKTEDFTIVGDIPAPIVTHKINLL